MSRLLVVALLVMSLGCTVSRSSTREEESTRLNLGPLIGLIGMAVDGDDKDDYEHFFHGEDCCCRKCR